jgi:hypothetical protein
MFASLFPSRRRFAGVHRFASAAIAVLLAVVMATGPAVNTAMAAKKPPKLPSTMLPLRITEVVVRDGELVALGTLGSNAFVAPITLTPRVNPLDATCPILDLALGPIELNLLGLNVETSAICLEITAHHGQLLGDLLCFIAEGLLTGIDLGDILGGLTNAELNALLDAIADLINEVLIRATAPAAVVGVSDSTPGACDILNLSLGPIDLNLLGLEVAVDDCANGPVTVDITAIPAGGLLGELLCDLDNLLSGGHANAIAIANTLTAIANLILALI